MAQSQDVVAQLVASAVSAAERYEAARKVMLTERQATREAANMVTSLAKVLGQDAPELPEAVVKVLAKRNRKGADEADED